VGAAHPHRGSDAAPMLGAAEATTFLPANENAPAGSLETCKGHGAEPTWPRQMLIISWQ
jgi:hypothetical protein